ncbi:hypothetical protein L1887_39025 [Cichorium endivia]|nr:hypothetical protein L1887_39025 [Cichorium endivia]
MGLALAHCPRHSFRIRISKPGPGIRQLAGDLFINILKNIQLHDHSEPLSQSVSSFLFYSITEFCSCLIFSCFLGFCLLIAASVATIVQA